MVETKDVKQPVLLELEYLQECYNAVLLRKVERGRQSIRTRPGYELLRSKYQPRLHFLHEIETENVDTTTADTPLGDTESTQQSNKAQQQTDADALHGDTMQESSQDATPSDSNEESDQEDNNDDDDERPVLEKVVGVYFDPRIKRFITDVCWPLAHFGDQLNDQSASIPEWQELEQEKYFAFTFKTLLWLFPGLPGFEAQDQAERDWQKDCEFDAYGSYGLSYEGFAISLIDLATACTSGSVEACLEFLQLMTKRLQLTLPMLRDPTQRKLLSGEDGDKEDSQPGQQLQEEIVWRQIPLERLTPCQLRPKAQYYELKAKLSMHPLVLMVLLGNEKPAELQLSTSAKLLICERDSRTSIRRSTIALKSHFVELEKQFLWTFRDLGDRPSLLLIPNHYISCRTLSLYACLRLINGREQELQTQSTAIDADGDNAALGTSTTSQPASAPPPILTLFSNIQEPFSLLYGTEKSLCGRIDRQSTRLFIIDHRERSNPFAITLKTSLIQNTASGGGAGAAAVVAALAPPSSSASTTSDSNSSPDTIAAHSFIFVVKSQDELMSKPNVRVQKMQATLPQQWYTTLSGPNESKSILINVPDWSSENSSTIAESVIESQDPPSPKSSAAGLYYLYIFSLHGFYFEAFYEDQDQLSADTTVSGGDRSSTEQMSETGADGDEDATTVASGSTETNEEDHLLVADDPLGAKRILNSASLLRRLLLMRKKCQKAIEAQPPPDLLEGSKVTNVKSPSAAETLKSKFLRARAMERQVRLLKNAKEVQTKVLVKLMRSKKKRGLLTGMHLEESSSGSSQPTLVSHSATEHLQSDEATKTDARVALLNEFFKDMAVHQPSQQELQDKHSQQAVDEKAEDALLDHFTNFFEGDSALQNLVDEEKWLPSDERAMKRKALIQERTLRSKGKASSHRTVCNNAAASALAADTTALTSEDYINTAQYIEELMREIAREEANASALDNRSTALTPEAVEAAQLRISWNYAQHRTQPRATSARTQTKFKDEKRDLRDFVDQRRRNEWMKSQYIQHLAASEHVGGHHESPLRSPFIPKMQTFHEQEQSMPWQAVWDAEAFAAKSALADSSELAVGADRSQLPPKRPPMPKSSHRPPERPKTTANPWAAGSASPRCEINTASQSAAFSYQNTRRIRSAQVRATQAPSFVPGREPNSPPALGSPLIQQAIVSNAIGSPVYPSSDGSKLGGTITDAQQEKTSKPEFAELVYIAIRSPPQEPNPAREVDVCPSSGSMRSCAVPLGNYHEPPVTASSAAQQHHKVQVAQQASPVQEKEVKKMKKKRTGRKQSNAEKRFARQVHELLAISTELKKIAESERASASEVSSSSSRYYQRASA